MKASLWFLSIAGWFIAAGIHLQAASTNAALLTLELRDGSRVVGKSGTENFKFHSEILGDLKLATEQLNSVELLPKTDRVKLVTTNGDVLSAEMLTKEIPVETSFGNINVPATALRRMSIRGAVLEGTRGGLVALWSGEGNGNDVVGGNPATPIGPLNYALGKKGQGFSFGGQNAYLLIHPKESLDVGRGDGFTMEGWINPSTVEKNMLIFEYERELGTASGSDVGVQFGIHGTLPNGIGVGCLFANIKDAQDGNHILFSPANLLEPGIWQHVALTYDRTLGNATFYLNGSSVAQSNFGSFVAQTSFANLLLGARTTFNSVERPSEVFFGKLDEIGIYSRALSAAEIHAIYAEENGGAESN